MLWFLIVLVLLLSDHDRSAGVVALVYLLVRLVRGVRAFRRGRGLGDEAFWNDAFRLLGRYSRTSGAEAGGAADALVSLLAAYGIPSSEIDRSLHAWREGREASAAEVAGASERLRRAAPRHGLGARLFAELALRQHARARGSAPVDAELEALLGALGLHPLELQTIHARILLEEEWRRMAEGFGRPGGTPPPPRAPSAEAYATLGVRPEASDEEVTLAYRRLLRRHHPDKLAASGASELALRMANERTQKIRAAYEEIRAARSRAV
ncbi:MAG: DnaJ domain-containing protein [Gammaproteobacteria bacterium]|nr:DnaJ domain-containing protein [Gammaproteobacteria bacterium]